MQCYEKINLDLQQVYLLQSEATEVLSHFIREYFRLKAVSSTDNKI